MDNDIFALSALEQRITGRTQSFFAQDCHENHAVLDSMIRGQQFLFIGGAGSIGSQTLAALLRFEPARVDVVDINENGLAELVRTLRSGHYPFSVPRDFNLMPLDYASAITHDWMKDSYAGYAGIFNFAALKHVRSEKNPHSIAAMLDTNVNKLMTFYERLDAAGFSGRLFNVSTDKAANPSSMMGATKRVMEHAMFSPALRGGLSAAITSARFANVAFSNGSLLQAWTYRLAQHQPLAVPEGCRRFFVSMRESGQLCMLAGLLGTADHIAIPNLDPAVNLVSLQDVLEWYLHEQGLKPEYLTDEDAAKARVAELRGKGKWPVLLTPLDTAGEKPYEEFLGRHETSHQGRLKSLSEVTYLPAPEPEVLAFRAWLKDMLRLDPAAGPITMETIKTQIGRLEPSFLKTHVLTDNNLDQRV
jgi:FlaA1/EpsC-like NDP-sugar epimerase